MSLPTSSDNEFQGHYKTAGFGLILVGLVNATIASYSLLQNLENAFIDYKTMLIFAVSFIVTGLWMRTVK